MESSSVTVTDMEHSTTFSLTELAALTGSGKARLRAMIEVGTLAATRAESGRREWIVRREDAVAANLRVPADVKLRSRMVIHRSGGADGVDAAMQELFAELCTPPSKRAVPAQGPTAKAAARSARNCGSGHRRGSQELTLHRSKQFGEPNVGDAAAVTEINERALGGNDGEVGQVRTRVVERSYPDGVEERSASYAFEVAEEQRVGGGRWSADRTPANLLSPGE